MKDFRSAGLPPREVALLEFVETLTIAPFEIGPQTVDALTAHGWSRDEIARASIGCALFNYLNRMADGLGIRLDYPASGEFKTRDPEPHVAPRDAADATQSTATEPSPASIDSMDPDAFFAHAFAFAQNAIALGKAWREYHLTGTPRLSAELRARLALYSAGLAHSRVSGSWARARAAKLGVPNERLDALERGTPDATNAFESLLFEHARRLTTEPWSTRYEHIEALLGAGLEERDIVKFTMLLAYLSFEQRVTTALIA